MKCTHGMASIYAQHVPPNDLHRFGVVGINRTNNRVEYIVEKPVNIDDRHLNLAITGLYVFPKNVCHRATLLTPSARKELEITDLINTYFKDDELNVEVFKRGISWFDTGTADSLLDAAHYVKTIQTSQGFLVGSPHEVAFRNQWVEDLDLISYMKTVENASYGRLLNDAFFNGDY